ncbi:MAG TPA: hypothetical protein VIV60_10090 [Polyangiaceae bacterium]
MFRNMHAQLALALLAGVALAACSSSADGGRAASDGGNGGSGGSGTDAGPGGRGATSGPGGDGPGTVGVAGNSSGLGATSDPGATAGTSSSGSAGKSSSVGGAAGGPGGTTGLGSSVSAGKDSGAAGNGGRESTRAPAAPAWVLSGNSVTWQDYAFTVPPSMQIIADGSKGYAAIGRAGCAITFFPAVASEPDPDLQAASLLTEAFSDATKWSGLLGIDNHDPLLGTYHRRTVTSQGLSAVDLSTGMKNAEGKVTSELGRILLVDLGTGKSAPIIGYQSNYDGRCLDEVLNPYEWVLVYYSLSFPQAHPANPHALQDTLIGDWYSSSSGSILSTGYSQVYAANGNYSYVISVSEYSQIDPNLIRETTSSWAGDGAWRLEQGLLEILPRDPSSPAQTNLMRIFWEYNTSTPTGWRWYLHTLDSCGATPCESWASRE